MSEYEATVSRGGYKIHIDNWGGMHFEWPDDRDDGQPLGLSPEFINEALSAREKVLEKTDE